MKSAAGGRRKGAGQKRKPAGAPVDHRLSDAMQAAIDVMVTDNLSRKEAAEQAGISGDAIRKAMQCNPLARRYYTEQVRAFVQCTKHEAAHVLRKEMSGPNAAARVAAARILLGDETAKPQPVAAQQTPGVTIIIEAPGEPRPVIGPPPMIEIPARPVESER